MTRMDPQDARQGKKGTPVLRVLISALILCVIAALGMGIYAWTMPDATIGSQSTTGGNAPASSTAVPGTTATPGQTGTSPSGTTPAN